MSRHYHDDECMPTALEGIESDLDELSEDFATLVKLLQELLALLRPAVEP